MRIHFRPAPTSRLCRLDAPTSRLRRLGALLALGGLALAWAAPAGHADTCSACPEPTLADLEKQAGFELTSRTDDDGQAHTDYVVTDGGECSYSVSVPPLVTIGKTWTVLRGSGTVYNCPWGDTSTTVTISISEGDSSEWKVEGEVSAEVALIALKLGGSLGGSLGGGQVKGEVRTLSQHIGAAFGHVLDWHGLFELADVTLDGQVDVTRRFAWWTKNEATEHTVHRKGDVRMACGAESVRLTRRASIGAMFHIWDGSCDAKVTPVDLGTFPRPKPPPVITPPPTPVPVPVPDEDPTDPPPSLPVPLDPDAQPSTPQQSADLDDPPAGIPPLTPLGDPSAQSLLGGAQIAEVPLAEAGN